MKSSTRDALMLASLLAGFGATKISAQAAVSKSPLPNIPASANGPFRNFPSPPAAPKGAPNVLVIMTDDVGFGASSTFGGPIPTPNLDELAKHGLRYNEFHTTAMCSPSRAALLTGRNHHAVGFGVVAELATDEPGYDALIPKNADTIAEVLRDHGYNTCFFGKNHNTPPWQNTPLGPFDRWPTGFGFDHFYGYNSGFTNQYAPDLVENTTFVDPPANNPNYILENDLATHAVDWLRMQQTLNPDHPFLLYYAAPSAHAPHQAPREWIDKFSGQFTEGWDRMREETFARQKAMGVIPATAELTPRPQQIPSWVSLTKDQQKVSTRLMQVYAGMLAYSDNQVGRILDELRRSGELDKTLIIFIQGDNGAAAEDLDGTMDMLESVRGRSNANDAMLAHLDELGGPKSMENYPVGWAWSMDTPFQWSKIVASHFGGMRNGMVVSWPGHLQGEGSIRSQFHHLIDIAPTIYEAVGVKPPLVMNGVRQAPLEGVSMVYSFTRPDATSTHHSQYFELMGNRSYYKDGWIASTTPQNMPWVRSPKGADPLSFKWELYDLRSDYSQAHDLATVYPLKLKQLQAEFDVAARRDHVFPISAETITRLASNRKPGLVGDRKTFTYNPGPQRYPMAMVPDLNGSWMLDSDIEITEAASSGMIAVRGDLFSGWGLYMQNGRLQFVYRASNEDEDVVHLSAPQLLQPGKHHLAVSITSEGKPPNAHPVISLSIDGKVAASGSSKAFAIAFGSDMFVGRLGYETLLDGLRLPANFAGTIDHVTLSLPASATSPAATAQK